MPIPCFRSSTKVEHGTPDKDTKLAELIKLVKRDYPGQKVLIFTQYADTVRYLEEELKEHGVKAVAGVTGNSYDPTEMAWRFSPVSNEKRDDVRPEDELRVLVATDVLSEGQNLQDCAVVVNYDLPWAIIRLIQRAGRVDRIGQKAEYYLRPYLPACRRCGNHHPFARPFTKKTARECRSGWVG